MFCKGEIFLKKARLIVYPLCAVIAGFAVWNLRSIDNSTKENTELYNSLAEWKDSIQPDADSEQKEITDYSNIGQGQKKETVNKWLEEMQSSNSELAGWITVSDTVIDYPIMQTTEDNDYYLSHNFERNEDKHGAPFADVNCRIDYSDNLVIYGHNMKDGTMFQNLMKFKDVHFFENSGEITVYSLNQTREYEVIAVMLLSADDSNQFPYFRYTDFSESYTFSDYMNQCREYSLWFNDEKSKTPKTLLTLSTCEYSKNDGRLVVVAGEK